MKWAIAFSCLVVFSGCGKPRETRKGESTTEWLERVNKQQEEFVASRAIEESTGPRMTAESFMRLKPGMSWDQVIEIVGHPSQEISRSLIGDVETVMYQWDAGTFSSASVMFQNGSLVSKSQFGLQ